MHTYLKSDQKMGEAMNKRMTYIALPRREGKPNLSTQRGPKIHSVQVAAKMNVKAPHVKLKVARCVAKNTTPQIININQNPDDDRMVYLVVNMQKMQGMNGHMSGRGKPQVGRLGEMNKLQKGNKPEVEVGKLGNDHRKRAPIRQKEKPVSQASDFEAIMNRRKKYVDTMDNTGRLLGEIRQQGDGKKMNLSQNWIQVRDCARMKAYHKYDKIRVVKMPELNLY